MPIDRLTRVKRADRFEHRTVAHSAFQNDIKCSNPVN
jgi:hypothetical protein